jgi:hypothetical protein
MVPVVRSPEVGRAMALVGALGVVFAIGGGAVYLVVQWIRAAVWS